MTLEMLPAKKKKNVKNENKDGNLQVEEFLKGERSGALLSSASLAREPH